MDSPSDPIRLVDINTVISGNLGRLGRALTAVAPGPVGGWDRPLLDLDDPTTGAALVHRDRPALVIHTAAMTDVDHAAREPDLAMRRNGEWVAALARACREAGAKLMLISTNEVFDGERDDGVGYREDETTNPRNPYGRSKLAGEQASLEAYDGRDGLWVVRTAWLFGPPGGDFPEKITAASDRFAGQSLAVVSDEIGSPTYTVDLARAVFELVERTDGGTFHLTNGGSASRFDWARAVLDERRPGRDPPHHTGPIPATVRPAGVGRPRYFQGRCGRRQAARMAGSAGGVPGHDQRRGCGMKMRVQRTTIPEVLIVEHDIFQDDRGFFMEAFRSDTYAEHAELGLPSSFVQLNHSRSSRGVTRGLHFQWDPPMGKLMRVARGEAFIVAVDIRPGSPTLGRCESIRGRRREPPAAVGSVVVRARLLCPLGRRRRRIPHHGYVRPGRRGWHRLERPGDRHRLAGGGADPV